MSGGFPQSAGYSNLITFNSTGTQQFGMGQITQSASANTMGAWSLLGALTADCVALLLRIVYLNASGSEVGTQVDIGIGGAGSQVVLIPTINQASPNSGGSTNLDSFQHVIPVSLPQGTQIWARAAVNIASSTCQIGASFASIDSSFSDTQEFAGIDVLGSTGTGLGTAITPGAGSKGSYVQLGTTARDYVGFFLEFDFAAGSTAQIVTLVDISIGGSGSQVDVLPNLLMGPAAGFSPMDFEFIALQLPQGTKVWARACNLDGSVTQIGVTLYGVF